MYRYRLFLLSFLILVVMLQPGLLAARTCYDWPAIFQENRKLFDGDPQDKRILILPFVNKTEAQAEQWLSDAFRLGLFLMLETAESSDVIEVRSEQTTFDAEEAVTLGKAAGADYVIAGQYRRAGDSLEVYVRFVEVSASKQRPIEEETIEWPSLKKYSELMIHLARRASKAFKGVRADTKRLKLTEHRVRTIPALQHWVLAQIADHKGSAPQIKKAHGLYQEAIKNDFNYCYGYLGLAQTYAEMGFMRKVKNQSYQDEFQAAHRELTKLLVLCPTIAELWGKRVSQYLEANALQTAAADRIAEGDMPQGRELLVQALSTLPGDVVTLRTLTRAGADGSHQERLRALTQCR